MSVFQKPQSQEKASDNLLAELMSEFGKKPKGKASTSSAPKEKTARDLNKEFHQRISGSNTQTALQLFANTVSKSWSEVPGFSPVARIIHIQIERCRCCSGIVKIIGNEFTRFESSRLRAKVDSPELLLVDEFGFELPRILEEWPHEVDMCAQCLRVDSLVNELLSAGLMQDKPAVRQLNLFSKLEPKEKKREEN